MKMWIGIIGGYATAMAALWGVVYLLFATLRGFGVSSVPPTAAWVYVGAVAVAVYASGFCMGGAVNE